MEKSPRAAYARKSEESPLSTVSSNCRKSVPREGRFREKKNTAPIKDDSQDDVLGMSDGNLSWMEKV